MRVQATYQTISKGDADYWRSNGESNDLITFWEIYSRMGMGQRLRKSVTGSFEWNLPDNFLDQFGDNIYLCVSEEHPWPLNLGEDAFSEMPVEEVFHRLQLRHRHL